MIKLKEELIDNIKKTFEGATNIYVDSTVDKNRTNESFYGGTVICFNYRKHEIIVKATGIVDAFFTLDDGREIDVKDQNDAGELGCELIASGIDTDEKLHNLLENNTDAYSNNNWWELQIWDPNGLLLTLGDDPTEGFTDFYANEIEETKRYIDEVIDEDPNAS